MKDHDACDGCGCTESARCSPGCTWEDPLHMICTSCGGPRLGPAVTVTLLALGIKPGRDNPQPREALATQLGLLLVSAAALRKLSNDAYRGIANNQASRDRFMHAVDHIVGHLGAIEEIAGMAIPKGGVQ